MRMDAEAWAQKQNYDNQYLGDQAQMDAALGQQYAQTKLGVQNMNDQNAAARRNFLSASAGQLSQFGQSQQMMRNQRLMDQKRLDIIRAYGPDVEKWMPSLLGQ